MIREIWRKFACSISLEAVKTNFKVVDFLKNLAARKKIMPGQIALAWLLAQKPWIVPIPGGGTKMEHLDDNRPAVEVRLSAEDMRELDDAFCHDRHQRRYVVGSVRRCDGPLIVGLRSASFPQERDRLRTIAREASRAMPDTPLKPEWFRCTATTSRKCRRANLETAIWKSRLSDSASKYPQASVFVPLL